MGILIDTVCRIAFDSNPFDANPDWTDVSDDLVEIHINRGKQQELGRVEVGELSVTLKNFHGNYWPKNTSGTYYGKLLPLKRINIRVKYNGVYYDRYTGYIDEPDYDFMAEPLIGPVVTYTCVDGMEALTRLLVSGYSAELSGARWGHILDDRGWPVADRSLATGQTTIQAGPSDDTNALDHGYSVNDSELGLFFIAVDGKATFHDRLTRNASPYNTTQATFGPGTGEFRFRSVKFSSGRQYIYNDIRLTREGGTEQIAEDTTSQTTYAKRTLTISGLLHNSDDDTQDEAYFLCRRQKDDNFRVQSMVILPAEDPANLFPLVLSFDISTRITLKVTAASIDEDYHIEGFREDWSIQEPDNWQVELQLSNASDLTYPDRETLVLYPNADGTYTEWDGAPPHWQFMLPAGGGVGKMSTYGANPCKDYYGLDDLASAGPIVKVTLKVWIYGTTGGGYSPGQFRLHINIAGTTHSTDFAYATTSSMEYTLSVNGPFTLAEVNAMQAGIEAAVNLSETVIANDLTVEVEHYKNW